MSSGCCKLVGNFLVETGLSLPGCVISVQNNVNTEYNDYGCSYLVGGSRSGTINISAYSNMGIHVGCPSRAGTQVIWLKKYSCELDETFFIFSGQGRSFKTSDATGVYLIKTAVGGSTVSVSASSQSGPSSLYNYSVQEEGLGMSYSGGPINFDTSTESGCTSPNMGIGSSSYYLQNFQIEYVPGSIPVASYVFNYIP